jgi:hypothetical protein
MVEKRADAGSHWRIPGGGGDSLVDHLLRSWRMVELAA